MRTVILNHEDLSLFGHDISQPDYSFFAKHKDAFRRMFREQGNMFWRRFLVSFKAYTMSYGIIENPLKKTNGKQYHHMVTEAYSYLECQLMGSNPRAPKVFVEDSGILAQSRHLLGGIEAKPYKTSKDPFYMKDSREVFRRVFGDPKDGPYLTLRVYIMYPLCMKMGATLCKLLRKWLDASDGTEDDIYWTAPSVDLFFSFGFHDDISRLRHDIEELRKERGRGPLGVDIPRPLHLMPRDTIIPDDAQFVKATTETTIANRADILAGKKEEKRLKKKAKEQVVTETASSQNITGLEMKRGAEGTKFKVQFAQGGVSQVDVTRSGEEVKIKVTRTTTTNGVQHNDPESARKLQKLIETDVEPIVRKEQEDKESKEDRERRLRNEEDAKAVRDAWEKTKKANKGKPLDKEAEYHRKKAKETFADIDKDLEPGQRPFGVDDPLIKLFREAVEDPPADRIDTDEVKDTKPNTFTVHPVYKEKKLRECANCNKVEAVRKTFKACQRCRELKLKPKYYCGRTCQVKDWEAKHKKDHKDLKNKLQAEALQEPEGVEDREDSSGVTSAMLHLKIHRDQNA